MKKSIFWVLIGLLAIAFIIQAVPYGRDHINPPIRMEPVWDSESTRSLAKRACFDCHSNETLWPWYSNIAPVSWLVQHDVDEGRSRLNFSEWDRPQHEAEGAWELVQEGEMPPWYYLPLHAKARLNPTDEIALIQGLQASLARE